MCSLALCVLNLLYHFNLFGSHTSQTSLPKPKFGQCHASWRALPKAYEVMVANLSEIWCENPVFSFAELQFCSQAHLWPLAARISAKMTCIYPKYISSIPKILPCHGSEWWLPKYRIHQTSHGHKVLPNRSKWYSMCSPPTWLMISMLSDS